MLARTATVIALGVVILGAYVRLSDAGLGCPDWPGCYGKLIGIPETATEIEQAHKEYPQSQVNPDKAWKEVLHRYLAIILGLLILTLTGLATINRRYPLQPLALPWILIAFVVFQSILGMWTVTMLLKPIIVTTHLLGGLTTLALLWYLALPHHWHRTTDVHFPNKQRWRYFALLGIGVLIVQITLGGWTASNYAALACPDFPTCQQQWWPTMDFETAFQIGGKSSGTNYEFGVLSNAARTAIHLTHRIGALLTLLLLSGFLIALLLHKPPAKLAVAVAVALVFLLLQMLLGILNVTLSLPLFIATAHNATAAMLLLNLITIVYMLKS